MVESKNVVIVGGVAGGMSCATRLRRLNENAQITVIEREQFISPATCGLPYALGGVIASEGQLHVQTANKMGSWFNIKVLANTELVTIDRVAEQIIIRDRASGEESAVPYDKLVLAQGAEAGLPKLDGIGSNHVFTLQTISSLQRIQAFINANKCRRAAIIGGGFIGLEAAENLRRLGLDVALLEYQPHVFAQVDANVAESLHTEIRQNGVHLILNARITKITEPSSSHSGEINVEGLAEPIPADIIIVAAGVHARTAIAKAADLDIGEIGVRVNHYMQTSDPDIYAVGDMVEVPHLVAHRDLPVALAGPASRQGRIAADHICDREHGGFQGNVGTAICKVFDLVVGVVGLSNTQLDRLGINYDYVTVHPPDHAAYYPGSEQMTIKVSFEKLTGKLLGAQIFGRTGVDKRIDVFAMAIRARMSIEDLEHVELAYAPPYGAAKDAVNMAGFVGSNVLRGDVQIVHAADLSSSCVKLGEYQVVDVRSEEEFANVHLKGAVNIPIGNIRERIGELRKDIPTLVYCWVGYRGYLAYRVLLQNGFTVVNLDGGMKAVVDGGHAGLVELD